MTWTADESIEPSPKPRWRRKLFFSLAALFMVAMFLAMHVISGRREVARRLAEIRARGEPVTLEELAATYPTPPAEEDATRLWLDAAQSLDAAVKADRTKTLPLSGEAGSSPPVGQPWPQIETARQFLEVNAVSLQKLHEAATLGGKARYPVPFQDGFKMLVPHLPNLKSAARCLMLEANVRARDGEMHAAAESLSVGLKMSQSLQEEPSLVAELVRIAINTMVVEELKRIGSVNLSDADLRSLQEGLREVDLATAFRRGAVGDRVMGISVFDNPESIDLTAYVQYVDWLRRSKDELDYLTAMEGFVALADAPWTALIDQTMAWNDALEAETDRRSVLTRLQTTALGMVSIAHMRAESIDRLAIISLAIARYRQQHGAAPQELSALVPELLGEIPIDPTDGSPYSYQATIEGYLLYSRTQAFPNRPGAKPDPETGADPLLVFRWPPLPEAPKPADDGDGSHENLDEIPVEPAAPAIDE